ncbi:hypothetical protein J7T55_007086 [Diaporthe amygdali]|uniref:uncharacterized protein n=1 Tax=Phomopsis amygdali TaxID=1214568 RepID=UPI0022FE4605|nr:uncharacterized protein J7T55_007086 [Diaporthe amygdali]KAJ0107874.1 hypothetical protein J7T55_007086 [Diaporthe amygdali]
MPQINGQEVGPIGFGLMGLTWRAKPCSEEQAFEAIKAALNNGCNFFNGGEFYGKMEYNSLVLLERYFAKYPEDADKVVLSVKGAGGPSGMQPSGTEAEINRSIGNVIKQLNGRKKLDIFECARRDQNVSMEETFGAMQKFIDEGKLGGISLSEVRHETLLEAVKITKVVAVEVELNLFATEVLENGIAATCAKHNIPLIAYSPLGRGLLTGEIKSPDDIPEDDMRKHFPRFQPGNFEHNLVLAEKVNEMAKKKGVTPGQFALGWVRTLSKRPGMPTIIPIPGATTAARVNENSKLVDLTDEEMNVIDEILEKMEVKGSRYPDYVPTNT